MYLYNYEFLIKNDIKYHFYNMIYHEIYTNAIFNCVLFRIIATYNIQRGFL